MEIIRKFIEGFKIGMAQAAAEHCNRIAIISGQSYAVKYRRTFFLGRIKKNRPKLTKLLATLTARGSGGNMTYKEAVKALRGDHDRRRNPLDELKF